MYEYLVENLINPIQVISNLNRTADKGLISKLNRKQLNKLALKYFGVDSSGKYTDNLEDIVAYKCPYSGEIIRDLSSIHLDHILPISSNGGTVLFNCIPVSQHSNNLKIDKHLITWLYSQGYFDYERLERIVNYMFEAYDLYINEQFEEEFFDETTLTPDDSEIQNDNLSTNELNKLKKIEKIGDITYYQFLSDLINELSKYKDVSEYNSKLQNLITKNIFSEIDEIEKLIKLVQSSFKEMIEEDSTAYLMYSLKINMKKLLKSLKNNNYEEELRKRLDYIVNMIKESNLSLKDYFESLMDIEDINPIYLDLDEMSENSKKEFIEKIKIGTNTKILILVDMIKHAKTAEEIEEIFNSRSKGKNFTTYKQNSDGEWVVDKEYGPISKFYSANKSRIQSEIDRFVETDLELRDKLDEYYMNTLGGQHTEEGKARRLKVFIDMIKHAKTAEEIEELFKTKNSSINFVTYKQNENGEWVVDKEYGPISKFYSANKSRVQSEIEKLIETDLELRDKLDEYYMNTHGGKYTEEGRTRRLKVFIDMIKYAKTAEEIEELFSTGTKGKNFTTYKQNNDGEWVVDKEYGPILTYWVANKSKIQPEIEKLVETDLELRDKLDEYYMNTRSGQLSDEGKARRQEIFIDMIKHAKTAEEIEEIFNFRGKGKNFTTYKQNSDDEWVVDKEYGPILTYWVANKSKIQPEIEKLIETDLELRDKLDEYYMTTQGGQHTEEGKARKLKIFIDMIKYAKTAEEIEEIFKTKNSSINFVTYKQNENDEWVEDKKYEKLGHYWSNQKIKAVLPSLFFSEEYASIEYDIARERIMYNLNHLQRRHKLPEFNNIYEYILTLDVTKKEVKELIKVRDEYLARKQALIKENEKLKQDNGARRIA